MSSTNKTTNYNLSQFIGTDKPAWLTDYNQDMSKIDAGIDAAQDTATAADGKADANTTNIGELTYLSTTAKNNLVSAINEVDGNADVANQVASAAQTTANTAKSTADNIANQFDLSNVTSYTATSAASSIGAITTNIAGGTYYLAKNDDGTICKLYGSIDFGGVSASGTATVKLITDSGLRPAQDFDVTGTSIKCEYVTVGGIGGVMAELRGGTLTFKTTGEIYYSVRVTTTNRYVSNQLIACVIFVKDFGDEPQE